MRKRLNRAAALAWIGLIGLMFASCASTSYIGINYNLPPAASTLAGKTIYVQATDNRSPAAILAPSAKEDFEHFTGLFSLSVGQAEGKPVLVGAYDVPALFQAAFARRLQELGAAVAKTKDGAVPVNIAIDEFVLERQGRRYLARLSYSASLAHPNGKSVTKTVSGSAERMKITGKRDMEKLLGEIFTDMVNRLDVADLLRQSGY